MTEPDPIARWLRADAEALVAQAPPPNAAALWHRVQSERRRRLQRLINAGARLLQAAAAVAALAAWRIAPASLVALLPPLLLVLWLSTGIGASWPSVRRGARR